VIARWEIIKNETDEKQTTHTYTKKKSPLDLVQRKILKECKITINLGLKDFILWISD